jgi:predicted phosphodiesterase
MTRWGLLADIHGNLPALQSALARFQAASVEKVAVLGDNLGRGDSDGCVRLIREVASLSVLGNRDQDWQDRVGPEARAYVLGLPRVVQDGRLLFSHGDARLTPALSSNDIPRCFTRARVAMSVADARVWLFGHTHRARLWRVGDGPADVTLLFDAATEALPARLALEPLPDAALCRWIVNVGSAGLPFPGKGPASAAIMEWEDGGRGWVEFFPL